MFLLVKISKIHSLQVSREHQALLFNKQIKVKNNFNRTNKFRSKAKILLRTKAVRHHISYSVKRFLQRIAIDITRKLDYRTMDKSTHGKECFSICQKLIGNPESELIVSPLTAKRYIKNDY